jgi:hypothetical protein
MDNPSPSPRKEWREQDAEAFFAELFRGKHHIPGKLRQETPTCWSVGSVQPMSSFDYDDLTRLVFLAHEYCVRVELLPSGPGRLRIAASKRVRFAEAKSWPLVEAHPTLEEAVEKFRARRGESWNRVAAAEQPVEAEVTP